MKTHDSHPIYMPDYLETGSLSRLDKLQLFVGNIAVGATIGAAVGFIGSTLINRIAHHEVVDPTFITGTTIGSVGTTAARSVAQEIRYR